MCVSVSVCECACVCVYECVCVCVSVNTTVCKHNLMYSDKVGAILITDICHHLPGLLPILVDTPGVYTVALTADIQRKPLIFGTL